MEVYGLEEKKAIEYFKSNLEMTKEMGKKWGFQEEIKNNETILNLIEKQSKEIEELKEQCKEVVCVPEGTCFMLEPKDVDKKWKDKIKAKIEEIDEVLKGQLIEKIRVYFEAQKEVLQSLLEKE